MRRWLYLISISSLQLALVGKLAPVFAVALSIETAPGLAPSGWPATLQLVATAAAIFGTTIVLVFPAVALSRHRRSGPLRFYGVPGWGVALTVGGCAMLGVGAILTMLAPTLPVDIGVASAFVAQPMVAGGLALATAGVLCAEILHRAVVPSRAMMEQPRGAARRAEVADPPDLRTRIA